MSTKSCETSSSAVPRTLTPVAEYVRMSTDHQKYSIANQSAFIHAYAHANGMQIIKRYSDPGKSGLTIRQRPGLSAMLAEVVSGCAPYRSILVYDVTRWGRFQDVDESAHYEFLCKAAGVNVLYCAEQFGADGTPFGSVLKALKRAMAGEFSRELSVKVAAGKKRIGGMGFRIGGVAGFGLRRQLLENGTTPGLLLAAGQRKSIQSDRVTLVPGPLEEIRIIQRIYRDYVYMRKSEAQIVCALKAEGVKNAGHDWSRMNVRTVLTNEKYLGNNVVGRLRSTLGGAEVRTPPDAWSRCEAAFPAIVTHELFIAAQAVRKFNRIAAMPEADIIRALKTVLMRHKRLSSSIINAAPELPCAITVATRFGGLVQAYARVGFDLSHRHQHHAVNLELKALQAAQRDQLTRALIERGCTVDSSRGGLLLVDEALQLAFFIARHQQPRPTASLYRIAFHRHRAAELIVALRMLPGNEGWRDFLVVPRAHLSALPKFLRPSVEPALSPHKAADIAAAADRIKQFAAARRRQATLLPT